MKLEEAVALPAFQQGDLLIQLYHNFLVDFEHRISPLKLGHLAVAVSSRYTDRAAAAIGSARSTSSRRRHSSRRSSS